jgi:hypothetical protein
VEPLLGIGRDDTVVGVDDDDAGGLAGGVDWAFAFGVAVVGGAL